jgi:hypothetical protein
MTWNIERAGLMLKKVGGPQGRPGLNQGPPGRAATGSRDVFFRLILLRTFLPTPSSLHGRFFPGTFLPAPAAYH